MAQPAPAKKIALKSVDDGVFEVDTVVAKQIETVQSFIDGDSSVTDSSGNAVIPLPNVYSRELARIVEYCNNHQTLHSDANALTDFDNEFVRGMSQMELKELILAANYLNVKGLLDFLNQTVANLIANKSVEYVREFFGIVCDYSPEEEARLREENAWAFEGVDED